MTEPVGRPWRARRVPQASNGPSVQRGARPPITASGHHDRRNRGLPRVLPFPSQTLISPTAVILMHMRSHIHHPRPGTHPQTA